MKIIRLFSVFLVFMCLFSAASAEQGPVSHLGETLSDFEVTTISGEVFRLSDVLKEKEAVFINLWATWCPPCRAEFPYLEEAWQQYQDQVSVIALSVELKARAIIVATGARPRPLGLPGEEKLIGRGISYCALCDGAFHKGQNVAVVGGGNTAAQAAVFLSDICSHVTVLQDLDHFTCDQRDYEAMRSRENISFQTSTRISALEGDDHLTGLKLLAADGASSELPVQGLFVSIGRIPDTEAFADLKAVFFIILRETQHIVFHAFYFFNILTLFPCVCYDDSVR